jgi:hypothetical protein
MTGFRSLDNDWAARLSHYLISSTMQWTHLDANITLCHVNTELT